MVISILFTTCSTVFATSNGSLLKSLSIKDGQLDRVFAPDRTFYNVMLPAGSYDNTDIVYEKMDEAALVSYIRPINIISQSISDRLGKVEVTGSDGVKIVYRLLFSVEKSAALTLNVTVNGSGKFTIGGVLSNVDNKRLGILILKTNIDDRYKAYSTVDINSAKMQDTVAVYEEKNCDIDGNYTLDYSLPTNTQSGLYRIYAFSDGLVVAMEKTVFYTSQDELNDILDILGETPATGVSGFINDNAILLDLDMTYYNDPQLVDKDFIYNNLANKNFDHNLQALKETFKYAVAISMFNNFTADKIQDALTQSSELLNILGIDLSGNYQLVFNKGKVFERILTYGHNMKFNSADTIVSEFKKSVVVSLINEATRGTISGLMNNNEELSLEMGPGSKFLQLRDNVPVYKAILNNENDFESIESIRNAFNNAVNAQWNTENSNGGTGSTKGTSNGGSSTYNFGAQPKPIPNIVHTDVAKYNDIDSVEWAKEAIHALTVKGIVSGRSEGIFAPNDHITREEFVKMLVLAFHVSDADQKDECVLTDVEKGKWYYNYICIAIKDGIVNGKDDGSFGVSQNISRQDMASMAYRVAKSKRVDITGSDQNVEFEDYDSIATYAKEGVSTMSKSGIINGIGGNRFNPDGIATRAEAAKIIFKLLALLG
jgi:hypothetical protein